MFYSECAFYATAIDLETRRLEWDTQGIEMASNQEKAKRSRRVVADSTKGAAEACLCAC